MNKDSLSNPFGHLKSDLPAGIVVFLVAVPLCLGIALASGAPLFSGIIAGIIGGIVVGAISGSSLGVSGPAAGLAVIVLTAIIDLGSYQVFLLAVMIAGVIQIIMGLVKAGVIGYYFPSSVIKGMLSGIGILIILKQLPHAFGYDSDPEGDMEFIQTDGHNTFSELYFMLNGISLGAVIISVLALVTLILWEQKFMKMAKFTQIVQGPLVVVVSGILLGMAFGDSTKLGLRPEQLVSIPVSGSLAGFFALFTFPDFSQIFNKEVYIIALTLAVVASLETLLSVEAADKLDPAKRITPTNRELIAQGVGNLASGLIGGLPVTQVIVRSSTNIQSGGKTKASAIFHGVLLLISVILIPKILNLIPLASLAAILLMVGYKLAKPTVFKEVFRMGISEFLPFIITIVGIVFTDLLIGISLGLISGVMYILWNNYRTPYHFDFHNYKEGEPIRIALSEDVSFLNKASILNMLSHLPESSHLIVDASGAKNIHVDILEIFRDFQINAPSKNIQFEMVGFETNKPANPVKSFQSAIRNLNKD